MKVIKITLEQFNRLILKEAENKELDIVKTITTFTFSLNHLKN
jgi:hypothetical protein